MSTLTKKRVHWNEVVDGITYDEDVDVLTSADAVIFNDNETLQDKYDSGDIARGSQLGDITTLDTNNTSNLVDAVNEVNAKVGSNITSIETINAKPRYAFALGREEIVEIEDKGTCIDVYYHLARTYKGVIYLLNSNGNTNKGTYKYSGSGWSKVTDAPTSDISCSSASAVEYNGYLHLIKGTSHYKFDGSKWTSDVTAPFSVGGGCMVVYRNELHILGNSGKHYKFNGSAWEPLGSVPNSYSGSGSVVAYKDEIHLMAGANHYKWDGSTWTRLGDLPYEYSQGDAVVYNNKIYLIAGYGTYGYQNNKIHHYDGTEWRKTFTLPYYMDRNSAVIYEDKIFIIGNNAGDNQYTIKVGNYITGYAKAGTEIYLPILSSAKTSNLEAIEDGYRVITDGKVEIAVLE